MVEVRSLVGDMRIKFMKVVVFKKQTFCLVSLIGYCAEEGEQVLYYPVGKINIRIPDFYDLCV